MIRATRKVLQNQQQQDVVRISYHELKHQTPKAIAAAKEAFCSRSGSSYGALAIYDIQNVQLDLNNTSSSVNRSNNNDNDIGGGDNDKKNNNNNWKESLHKVFSIGQDLALNPNAPYIQARNECGAHKRVGPGWSGNPGNEQHSLQSGFYTNVIDYVKKRHSNGGFGRMNTGEFAVGVGAGVGVGDSGGGIKDGGGDVRVWGENRWPKSLNIRDGEYDGDCDGDGDFEECVHSAAEIMHHVTLCTLDLARKAALEVMRSKRNEKATNQTIDSNDDGNGSSFSCIPNLREMAEQSNFLPARLVYYDANYSREDTILDVGDHSEDSHSDLAGPGREYWLPWHVDFNMATAFAPAIWINETAALNGDLECTNRGKSDVDNDNDSDNENPEHSAGLLLRNTNGNIRPAALGDDCILVQLGAHSQLATGGLLRAGPHAVGKWCGRGRDHQHQRDGDSSSSDYARYDGYGRLSFGLFVYGPWDARMKPSTDLMYAMGMIRDDKFELEHDGEDHNSDSIIGDDFGGLMRKAYTGETVLEGYRKFESYMNHIKT